MVPFVLINQGILHPRDFEDMVPGNTWLDLTRLGVEQNCLTFVRWRNCFVGTQLDLSTPLADVNALWKNIDEVLGVDNIDLQKSELKRELNGFPHAFDNITGIYLETLMEQNFMFARKFHTGAQVDYGTEFGVFSRGAVKCRWSLGLWPRCYPGCGPGWTCTRPRCHLGVAWSRVASRDR